MTEYQGQSGFEYLRAQTGRHLSLLISKPSEMLNPLFFFLLVIILFPIGLGPERDVLSDLAPGILWVVALLSNLMISQRLFVDDFDDGSLEQLVFAPVPLALAALPQLLAIWLTSGLLLALVSPVFALMLGLPEQALIPLMSSLALGSAVMCLLGGVGAALTVGVQRGGILLGLLILPLYIPVLIVGSRAVTEAVITGGDPTVPLAFLGAALTASLLLAPFAIAAGLRISLEL